MKQAQTLGHEEQVKRQENGNSQVPPVARVCGKKRFFVNSEAVSGIINRLFNVFLVKLTNTTLLPRFRPFAFRLFFLFPHHFKSLPLTKI